MIKINLLGVPKPVARAAAEGGALAPEALVVGGVLLVVLGIIAAFLYLSLNGDIKKLNVDLTRAQAEKARLEGIRKENEGYLQRIAQLDRRSETTRALLNSRIGPVELMRALGLAADRANDLYLASVTTQSGRLMMKGAAKSIDSVANFLAALQNTGFFEDVQLRESYEDDQSGRLTYKFNLDCVYKAPAATAQAVPASQPGAISAPPGRRTGM